MNVLQANLTYRNALTPLNLANIKYIVIHHAEATTATPEDIHTWHLQNGWNGAGYNEYIRKDGTVYIMRGDNVGSQCLNYNNVSYGICCEGNYQTEQNMPAEQYNSLIERLKYHSGRFPGVQIVGHKELVSTACPGQYFPLDKAKRLEPLVVWVDWKTILQKVAASPEDWERSINAAVATAKADGNLGDLEVFKYLPELIEKIYNMKGV